MASNKKTSVVQFGLRCTVCGSQNYVTTRNKMNTDKLELKKYCPHPKCRKHTIHKSKDKLK